MILRPNFIAVQYLLSCTKKKFYEEIKVALFCTNCFVAPEIMYECQILTIAT